MDEKLDFERRQGTDWNKLIRSSLSDWNNNVETILQWSPFSREEDLHRQVLPYYRWLTQYATILSSFVVINLFLLTAQFSMMKNHGTRIIIYNLWEDDEGQLELDFDADPYVC